MKYLILFILLFPYQIIAQFDDEPRIIDFFQNYYSKPNHVENQYFLNINYGLVFYDKFNQSEFTNHYSIEGMYGFFRVDARLNQKNVFRFASDYAFLGNTTTDFKYLDESINGIESDAWRFGFGISDGFGYNFGKYSNLYLMHSSDWIWSRMDQPLNPEALRKFDEVFRFGNRYKGGFRLQLYKGFNTDIEYEHTLVYPAHVVPQWLGMWLIDNILQRWFDYFEPEWFSIFGRHYPWIRFIYKNALSAILYDFRQEEMYFPFESDQPLSLRTYKIGVTFIF